MTERLRTVVAHLDAAEREVARAVALLHEDKLPGDFGLRMRELAARSHRARLVKTWLRIRELRNAIGRRCECPPKGQSQT